MLKKNSYTWSDNFKFCELKRCTENFIVPCIWIKSKFLFTNKCTFYETYNMLKFTLKYLIFAPTCFGPPGPSSGSSR